ncbi:MAG: 3-hydroxyacyl-ACP dehydratase FabZ [Pseudomonadota bacterium]
MTTSTDAMAGIELPQMPMDTEAIHRCIPHRFPFLLVDRVVEIVPGERILAFRNISLSEPALQGHFPGNPVLPGVFIIEGLAQTAAIYGHFAAGGVARQCLLTDVSEARFRKPVRPGDRLMYEVKLVRQRGHFLWFEGVAHVDGEQVSTAKFSAMMR